MESSGSTSAAAMKEGGAYADIFMEMTKFIDQDKNANWSSNLYKAVTGTRAFGAMKRRAQAYWHLDAPVGRYHRAAAR